MVTVPITGKRKNLLIKMCKHLMLKMRFGTVAFSAICYQVFGNCNHEWLMSCISQSIPLWPLPALKQSCFWAYWMLDRYTRGTTEGGTIRGPLCSTFCFIFAGKGPALPVYQVGRLILPEKEHDIRLQWLS